jgi:hypothetical protein
LRKFLLKDLQVRLGADPALEMFCPTFKGQMVGKMFLTDPMGMFLSPEDGSISSC